MTNNNCESKSGKQFWDATITLSESAKRFHTPASITLPYENNPLDITLFISCYNEEKFIEDTLATTVQALSIVGITYEIIVIDDCSTDCSVQLIQKFIHDHPNVNIFLRANKINKGLAQNYIDCSFIGLGKYYRLICGDNPEPIDTLVAILKMIGKADIIIPYHVKVDGKSKFRRFISKTYTCLINLISGNKVKYYNGLQIHLRHNVMRWHPNTRGFGFQAGLLCLLLDLGFTFKEVPCVPIERRSGGGSAMTWKNLRSVVHTLTSILLRRLVP